MKKRHPNATKAIFEHVAALEPFLDGVVSRAVLIADVESFFHDIEIEDVLSFPAFTSTHLGPVPERWEGDGDTCFTVPLMHLTLLLFSRLL